MVCALTVRKLRPGSFEEFREAFMQPVRTGRMPDGWRRFNMLRDAENPDQVICLGLFDGTVEELRANAALVGYEEQQAAIAAHVESVGVDGVFEVIEDLAP
ncbi:MAG TPA: antibiotic biosynthesis monooxygenase [Solirubrobacteraceae bacterium]|nr:antibiotic biosynthesis monooxygenase [Solirubrobacteraceae bacterium]